MSAQESLKHAYFYDALSGRFQPPSDPEARTHTLARLMNAALEKGTVTHPNSHNERHTYRPFWAPISAVVQVSHWDIHSLTLIGEQRQIELIHILDGGPHRNLRVLDTSQGTEPIIDAPLGHATKYDELQERVRLIAQDFFNAFPKQDAVSS